MKLHSVFLHPDDLRFIIAEDSRIGYCLYVYEYPDHPELFLDDLRDDACVRHQKDHHQDDVAMAQRFAFNKFGVPLDSWVRAR